MKLSYLITFLLLFTKTYSQVETDYYVYHNKINEAEISYFSKNDVEKSLKIYDSIFEQFEFIFLKDLIIAAQIAKFNNKDYKKYIIKSFEFGFKIDDLKKIPILESVYKNFINDKTILIDFKESRKKYLNSIDFEYLDYIYDLAIRDQVYKHKDNYERWINKNIESLMDTIKKKGFPGEKKLGISDTLIFKEARLFKKDINDRARKLKITKHFVYRSNKFQFDTSITIFLHHRCIAQKYKSILLNEVKKGNIHPQDIAFFSDFNSKFENQMPYYCSGCKNEGIYTFSPYKGDLKSENEIKVANELRKELFMIPYEVVQIKKKYSKDYNFILNFGYNGQARL